MFNISEIIKTVSYSGVFAIIFAESGLMVGFFFPGDSLLFTAGFLASQGFMNIWVLAIGCFIAAISGNTIGYLIGHKFGKILYEKKDTFFFKKSHLKKAHSFYEKHGGKTIILAQFVPVVRAFAPVAAGIAEMHYRSFILFNVIGALLWAVGVTVAGYYLGQAIPNVDHYLLPIIGIIVLASIAPGAYHLLKTKEQRAHAYAALTSLLSRKK